MKSKALTILGTAGVLLSVMFLIGATPIARLARQWEYGIYIESVGYYDWQEGQQHMKATDPIHFFERMGFPKDIEVDSRTGRLPALALNHLGKQGWELVDVRAAEAGRDIYLFKRAR